ncbi:N-methyl-D-aspartate receptor NMDAR2C subunit [Patescibacteria group bacterium]|nr:MAG: N-methyl-D-aspartate receptor NMDAR2C subunit [Patescibacteria group bacterium]
MTDKDKFLDLWQRIDAKGDGLVVFCKLKELYSEPQRKYHNTNHIHQSLQQFEYVRHLPNDPEAVEMAIWFHDAIYYPKSSNNELRSAKFALNVMRLAKLSDSYGMTVYALIMDTRHLRQPRKIDAQVLVDIDLSSLGKPWTEFLRDSKNIREEYSFIPDEIFYPERAKILQRFLKRPSIFLTQFFHKKYEEQARDNLTRWIKEFGA